MDKAPFFAGVQQDLYFLPLALEALAAGGRRDPRDAVEDAARRVGLGIGHLEGLGLYGTDAEDANGVPVLPEEEAVLPHMAEDCLDQLRQLTLVDEDDRVTPKGLACISDRQLLRDALSADYRIAGADGRRRRIVGPFRRTCAWIREAGDERRDKPESARYRPALCLAEFMRLNFWLRKADARTHGSRSETISARAFARKIMKTRKKALRKLDAGEGGIEYAALVMADAAAAWLEKAHGDEAWAKVAAARSSALMLCNARAIYPVGLPGSLQWLHPVKEWQPGPKDRKRKRKRKTVQ